MNKKEIQLFLKLEGIFSSFPVDGREKLGSFNRKCNLIIPSSERDLFNSF